MLPIKIYHKYVKCNPYPMCYHESEQHAQRAEALTPSSVKVHLIPLIKDIKNKNGTVMHVSAHWTMHKPLFQ